MGNQKLKWTAEEEEALTAGVVKYGAGKWKNILVDSEFKQKLANRSNVDLKVLDFLQCRFFFVIVIFNFGSRCFFGELIVRLLKQFLWIFFNSLVLLSILR